MIENFSYDYSDLTKNSGRSIIREILKLLVLPDIISFAGGLPSPESFPCEDLKSIVNKVMQDEAEFVLQYGTTEGDILLREQLCKMYQKNGLELDTDNILIVNGSQQGLDIVSRLFVNKGDSVGLGLPSYLGAISVFKAYSANIVGIPLDDMGLSDVLLEKK